MHPGPVSPPPLTATHQATLRLLVIPFLIYLVWLIEIFLLEGSRSLFAAPDPLPLLLYTLVGCILTGTIVPVLVIRRSFVYGAVNMHQIGFRSLRRTVAVVPLVAIPLIVIALLVTPSGAGRAALLYAFAFFLPTGIAAVMVCWVLIGTHLQALVRAGGALISISTGVVITGILFSLTTVVHTPLFPLRDPLVAAIFLGMITALLFFAVRDVYAATMVMTAGIAFLSADRMNSAFIPSAFPVVIITAILALVALCGVHLYFSRNYSTVIVVPDR